MFRTAQASKFKKARYSVRFFVGFPFYRVKDTMVWIKKIGKWVAIGMALVLLLLTFMYRGELSSEEVNKKYLTPESQFLNIDGMRVHVRVLGEGEPVVLLHGSFSSLHTWDIWQHELSPYFQTISLDFPGHGLTGPDSLKRYTTLDYSQLVLRVAEKLQLNEFHLGSWGYFISENYR